MARPKYERLPKITEPRKLLNEIVVVAHHLGMRRGDLVLTGGLDESLLQPGQAFDELQVSLAKGFRKQFTRYRLEHRLRGKVEVLIEGTESEVMAYMFGYREALERWRG